MRIVIIGAGIGGLTLAAGLRRDGHTPVVVERQSSPSGVGAGLVLHDEALGALAAAGVCVTGHRHSGFRIALADGRVVGRAAGKPGLAISRPALHAALIEACEGCAFRLGSALASVEREPLTVVLDGGERLSADLVVGADGLGSAVREAVGGTARRRYSGVTCWRGITSVRVDLAGPVEHWARGFRLGVVPLEDGTYLYLTRTLAAGGGGRSRRPRYRRPRALPSLGEPFCRERARCGMAPPRPRRARPPRAGRGPGGAAG
ncbi:MAG: 2-polyprenyl-6-methoxyphenol hydroxylase-like FAD-dependent oxidoreductase [Myxococcota bacterium]